MANVSLELRLVRVTSGVTTVLHEVVGGQINVSSFIDETPGAGTHEYRIQVRNSTGQYANGKINRRALAIFRAKR